MFPTERIDHQMDNSYLQYFEEVAEKRDKFGIESLNDWEKDIYTIWWLELEVNNGGFHQYFSNPTGDDAHIALTSLKKVGALKTAELLEKFIAVAFNGAVPSNRIKRNDILESIEKEASISETLESINLEFYRSDENLEDTVMRSKKNEA